MWDLLTRFKQVFLQPRAASDCDGQELCGGTVLASLSAVMGHQDTVGIVIGHVVINISGRSKNFLRTF